MYQNFFSSIKISKSNILGLLLGVAAGTGHATSLRFSGAIGFSEILFLMIASYLFYKSPRFYLKKGHFSEFVIRSYLLISVLLVMPIVTIIVYFFSKNLFLSTPVYILSFSLGVVLMFLIIETTKENLVNLKLATLMFAMTFIFMNAYAFLFDDSAFYEGRYIGFANNPNQLMLYITSIMLMLAIYSRSFFFVFLPFLIFIGIVSRSDTFLVAIFSAVSVFTLLITFNHFKIKFYLRLIIIFIFLIAIVLLAVFFYIDDLIIFLKVSDNQELKRLNLIYNAFLVTMQSPIFGWGAGSFSGIFNPFEGMEAHNNALDLSMQFGILFPIIIYFIMLTALIKSISRRDHLLASIITAFLVSGLFNFSARHFIFWLDISFLFQYVYLNVKNFYTYYI